MCPKYHGVRNRRLSARRELTVLVFKSKNKSKVSVMNVWFHNKILQIHLQKCDPYVNLSDIKIVDAEGTIGKV